MNIEEEYALVVRAREGDKHAQRQLLERHRGIVFMYARRYARSPHEIEDLAQEGLASITRAIESFDPQHKIRFVTYFGFKVRAAIGRAADNLRETIYVPARTREALQVALRKGLDADETAALPMLGAATAASVLRSSNLSVLSLDTPLKSQFSDGSPASLKTHLASENPTPDELLDQKTRAGIIRDAMQRVLATLPDRLRYVVEKTMLDEDPLTHADVARELGLSRERIRQLRDKGELMLRKRLANDPALMELFDVTQVPPSGPREATLQPMLREEHVANDVQGGTRLCGYCRNHGHYLKTCPRLHPAKPRRQAALPPNRPQEAPATEPATSERPTTLEPLEAVQEAVAVLRPEEPQEVMVPGTGETVYGRGSCPAEPEEPIEAVPPTVPSRRLDAPAEIRIPGDTVVAEPAITDAELERIALRQLVKGAISRCRDVECQLLTIRAMLDGTLKRNDDQHAVLRSVSRKAHVKNRGREERIRSGLVGVLCIGVGTLAVALAQPDRDYGLVIVGCALCGLAYQELRLFVELF